MRRTGYIVSSVAAIGLVSSWCAYRRTNANAPEARASRGALGHRVEDVKPLRVSVRAGEHDGRLVVDIDVEEAPGIGDRRGAWIVYEYVTALSPSVGCTNRSGGDVKWDGEHLLGALGGRSDILGGRSKGDLAKFRKENGVVLVTVIALDVMHDASGGSRWGENARILCCRVLRLGDFLEEKPKE